MNYFNTNDAIVYQIYEKIIQANNYEELCEVIKIAERFLNIGYEPLKEIIDDIKMSLLPKTLETHGLDELKNLIDGIKEEWNNIPSYSSYKTENRGSAVNIEPMNLYMKSEVEIPVPTMILLGIDNTLKFLKWCLVDDYFGMVDVYTKEEMASFNIVDYIGAIISIKDKKYYVMPATFLLKADVYETSFINYLTEKLNEYLANNPEFIKSIFASMDRLQSPLLVKKPKRIYKVLRGNL